jgi:hypothetical protein
MSERVGVSAGHSPALFGSRLAESSNLCLWPVPPAGFGPALTAPERVAVHAPDQRKRVPAHHDRGRIGGRRVGRCDQLQPIFGPWRPGSSRRESERATMRLASRPATIVGWACRARKADEIVRAIFAGREQSLAPHLRRASQLQSRLGPTIGIRATGRSERWPTVSGSGSGERSGRCHCQPVPPPVSHRGGTADPPNGRTVRSSDIGTGPRRKVALPQTAQSLVGLGEVLRNGQLAAPGNPPTASAMDVSEGIEQLHQTDSLVVKMQVSEQSRVRMVRLLCSIQCPRQCAPGRIRTCAHGSGVRFPV